jgi:hypothetical protein
VPARHAFGGGSAFITAGPREERVNGGPPILRAVQRSALVSMFAAVALGACSRPAAVGLEVTQFRHTAAGGVLLNEPLVVHFSGDLDPRSITSRTVRVLDEHGNQVDGALEVVGRRLSFEPTLPTDRALATGSFRASSAYTLELLGFPRVDALRGRDGAPLSRTFRARFSTTDAASQSPFLDDAPDRAALISIENTRTEAGAPWALVCDQALDPRTVNDELFVLVPRSRLERIRVRARLVENVAGRARVELMPVDAAGVPVLLTVGEHLLLADRGSAALCDLGGSRVPIPWIALPTGAALVVEPVSPPPAGPRFLESFTSSQLATPRAVDGAVGEARWEGDGRVRLRFPKSAGDGSDGPLVLESAGERSSWNATSLVVPTAAVVELPSTGLVVIAAQGALEIDGRVVRRVQTGDAQRREGEAPQEWFRRFDRSPDFGVGRIQFEAGESLSGFVERSRAAQSPITIFVAGGDIVVRGEIDADGPCVLVAGGRVRVPGRVVASEACFSAPYSRSSVMARIETLPIEIDEPKENPLATEQTWSILSGPIGAGGELRRWRAARVLGHPQQGASVAAGDPIGRFDVRYLGTRRTSDGHTVDIGPVADVRLLEDCETLRLLVDLTVSARGAEAKAWDPPWLDEVELVWE